jgi:ribonuclease P protein component
VLAPQVHNPAFLESDHEAHVSAEQPPSPQDPRLSQEDEHQERAERPQAAACQGTQTTDRVTTGERFRPQDRIRKRSEYKVIYDRGTRIPSGSFVLFVMRNGFGRPRLGITVTRRIGNAVRRNRAKRLLREIFRRHKSELKDVDIVVNGRTGLPDMEYARLESELLSRLRPFRKAS